MISLTPRLELCAAMCPEAERLTDVGCDHGYLAIRLVLEVRVSSALACDLRVGPLENAKSNIALYGLGERIDTLCTDGLDGVSPCGSDVVTICGMGGDNIADILRRAPWTKNAAVVAQPMTKQERLRRFLAENGYDIYEERLVYEDRRLYSAMLIGPGRYHGGDHMVYSDAMERDPLFGDYIRMFHRKYRKRFLGGGREWDGYVMRQLEERIKCL